MELNAFSDRLLRARNPETGLWTGRLSSSAVATATAAAALRLAGAENHAPLVRNALDFLARTVNADGGWGDSPESPSNPTAALLGYGALNLSRDPNHAAIRAAARGYLTKHFGGLDADRLVPGVGGLYGADATFAAPILAFCAGAGLISWAAVPRLPFELSLLPRALYRWANLPVVSYALPALISLGLAKRKNSIFRNACLRRLSAMQPASGGFLEAAPLTSFCAICLNEAGLRDSEAAKKALSFLENTVREDGAWAIDSDLGQWVGFLAVAALGGERFPEEERRTMAERIKAGQYKTVHPFNGAQPGGWGWTLRDGAVPDADDTSAALIALHELAPEGYDDAVAAGLRWLMDTQNRDGGMPTFCRGWGALPFDRSCPDISAHAWRALAVWRDAPPGAAMKNRIRRACSRLIGYLRKNISPEGCFYPLWFGDQAAPDLRAPIYGAAAALEHLAGAAEAADFTPRAARYLLDAQNPDGGWGGAPGVRSGWIMTARATRALRDCAMPGAQAARAGGLDFLRRNGAMARIPEPVGLYFANLWYSEALYNDIFAAAAVRDG